MYGCAQHPRTEPHSCILRFIHLSTQQPLPPSCLFQLDAGSFRLTRRDTGWGHAEVAGGCGTLGPTVSTRANIL